jgi:membrane fusion protein, multidrug efflux system
MSSLYQKRSPSRIFSVILFSALLLSVSSCNNASGDQSAAQPAPVPAYQVVKVVSQKATLITEYPASLRGEQNIEIRPKIDGYVDKIYVDEGSAVKKGQLLFRINAPQYQREVNTAQAAISSAKADVSTAQLQVTKTKPLVEKDIVSKYELQSAENMLKTREATLAEAKADLANAEMNLAYTFVTSPVNGVVGAIPYRLGSLINSTTAQPLTTVSSIGNMYVYFSLNEKQLLDFSRQYKGNTLEAKIKQLPPVNLLLADGSEYPEKGRVETISGLLNPETGSASFRATFPNPLGLLRSGGSAKIQIPVTVDSAIVIPQRSTYELQGKRFVYVVTPEKKVISTEIGVMRLAAGQYFVITNGLKEGETIVYESTSALRDSTEIKPEMLADTMVYKDLK